MEDLLSSNVIPWRPAVQGHGSPSLWGWTSSALCGHSPYAGRGWPDADLSPSDQGPGVSALVWPLALSSWMRLLSVEGGCGHLWVGLCRK